MFPMYQVTIWMIVIVLWLPQTTQARASPRCPDEFSAPSNQSIELAPSIAEQPSRSSKAYEFYHARKTFSLAPGDLALLASTADGTGWLSSDDKIVLQRDSGRAWEWDYRNPARTAIVPIPPQDVTNLFEPGPNAVDISLQDLLGPVFSSRAYYLVIYECGQPETPPATPTPHATPTKAATMTPTPTASPTSTATSTTT